MKKRKSSRKKAVTFEEKVEKFRLHGRICFKIRQLFMYSPHRKQALDLAKVASKEGLDRYRCAETGRELALSDVQVDHKIPIVDPKKGFPTVKDSKGVVLYDYTTYVQRMFDMSNLQVIGKDIHKQKTKEENKLRRSKKK